MVDEQLLEVLSDLEHQQWVVWTKGLIAWMRTAEGMSERDKRALNEAADILLAKWETNWGDYWALTESVKEHDRNFARRVVEVFQDHVLETYGLK